MIQLTLRLLGWLASAGAFVALLIDGTQSIAADEIRVTLLGPLLIQAMGQRFAAMQGAIERNVSPLLWDPVLTRLFALPVFIVLALMGALLILAAARRRPPIGFSSRP